MNSENFAAGPRLEYNEHTMAHGETRFLGENEFLMPELRN